MKARGILALLPLAIVVIVVSCKGGQVESEEYVADSLALEDSVMDDTLSDFEEKVDELRLPEGRIEAFSDFIFTFINNRRFQAERINFPLPMQEQNGEQRTITRGSDFRNDFQWPCHEEYTMLLTDPQQMEDYQNDLELAEAEVQIISLPTQSIRGYQFRREEGKWKLYSRRQYAPEGRLADFLQFYNRFSTDSLYQQENLAPQMKFATTDPDGDLGRVEGILDASQWSAFRPELPHGTITNINFGQPLQHTDHMVLLQCGTSSGMMDTYTFHYDRGGWKLTSYEN